jgi:hypothetical protein
MQYLPLGDESSPRGRWGICARALPEVLTRLWHFCDDAVHSRDTNHVAQFKIDALEREKDQIKNKHEALRYKIHEFQSTHLERLVDIKQLHYNRHINTSGKAGAQIPPPLGDNSSPWGR